MTRFETLLINLLQAAAADPATAATKAAKPAKAVSSTKPP